MGHIVNAKSTRLGKSIAWCDQWYSEKLYYSEYLHAMFRIRLYCYYIFTERHFDRKAIFTSHFELYRHFKQVFVEIYYYDGKWETEFEEYKIELYRQHYDMPMNKDPEMRKPYFLISSLKFLVLFNWMFYIKRRKRIKVLIKSRLIRLFRLVRIAKYSAYVKSFMFRKNKKFFYWNKVHLHFVLFLLIYVNAKIMIGRTSLWTIPTRNTIFRRIYYVGGCIFEVSYWLVAGSRYLSFIFENMTKFNKVFVNFFLTNNNCVNAKFLSRYIARKLQQGYPIKVLLNPIRKELAYLLAISTMPISSYWKISTKKYREKRLKNDSLKSLFRLLLSYIFINFKKIRKCILLKENSYLYLDIFILYFWLNNYNSNNIIKFGIDYFKKKIAYILFFEDRSLYSNVNYLVLPKVKSIFLLSKELKFLFFFDQIFNYFYVGKFCINSNILFKFGSSGLKGLGNNMSRFFKYYYINYCYKYGYDSLNVNFLRSRTIKKTRASNLIGYKMYLMGRFTRKQRAGHLWFSKGKTPLTSIMSFVDYAFHSLALKNSTITVKVWLYKHSDVENKHYLRMY